MIFTRPAQPKIVTAPPPAVPDPTVGWWKFHENPGVGAIPDASGNGNQLDLIGYNAGNWTTENGKNAYYIDTTNATYGITPTIMHNIGANPFTFAAQLNPKDLGRTNQWACFSNGVYSPLLYSHSSNLGRFDIWWFGRYTSSPTFTIATNVLNWFILRRDAGNDLTVFHNNADEVIVNKSDALLNNPFQVGFDGGSSYGEMTITEARFYDVALTDQECYDLMLIP